jgi:hypothetical protein
VDKEERTLVDMQNDPIVARSADTAVQKKRAWSYTIAEKGI